MQLGTPDAAPRLPARARTAVLPALPLLAALALAAGCSEDPTGCKSAADCQTGELCAKDGRCIPGAECTADAECVAKDPRKQCNLTSFACEFRAGFGDQCSDTRPCAFGEFCSTLTGLCYDSAGARDCVRRSQCPNAQLCDRRANKCIPETGCYGDDFCEDGELCDLVNHVCRAVATECTSCFLSGACGAGETCSETKECLAAAAEPKCRAGERCDPLGRCVQCTSSGECGPGLFCNVALGRCESNVQCADDPSDCPDSPDVQCVTCNAPEVCDPRSRRCQAPAAACESDVDCPGDQFCNLTVDPPVCQTRIPDCLNDRYEDVHDNNHVYDASPLTQAEGPVYEELSLCPGDVDWYALDLAAGTFLTVDARFRQRDGDVDLQLFLEDGTTLLTESRSSNDNERVSLEVGTELRVMVKVFLAVPSINPVPYRLVVTRDAGDVCPDDDDEPDDTPADAFALVTDVPHEGRLCPADPDWYVIRQVPAKTELTALLAFSSSLGNLDLELYRAGANTPLMRSAGNTDLERITYSASYAGDYYLRVVGKGADTNVYTVRVELREGAADACLDDRFEPNDLPSQALDGNTILGAPASGLTLCQGDDDWYALDLGPGEALTAELGFQPGADLELRLYPGDVTDPRTTALRQSTGTTPREFLGWRSEQAANYLLRVHGHTQDDAAPYELRLDRQPPLVSCDPDPADLAGRGGSLGDAWDLAPAPSRTDGLSICGFDEDWYRVVLEGGFVNVIRLQYVEADAQLDFALVNAGGQELVSTAGAGVDAKEVSVTVTGFGQAIAYVRVFRSVGFEATYNLTLDLVPAFNCFPDFGEVNDTRALASTVASSTITPIELRGLTLCPSAPNNFTGGGDEDWFVINPPRAGVRIEASIEFPQGDLSLELLGPSGSARACLNAGADRCYSDGFGDTELVSFTATVARPYYLHVGSIYSSPNVQQRPADADTGYVLKLDYRAP